MTPAEKERYGDQLSDLLKGFERLVTAPRQAVVGDTFPGPGGTWEVTGFWGWKDSYVETRGPAPLHELKSLHSAAKAANHRYAEVLLAMNTAGLLAPGQTEPGE